MARHTPEEITETMNRVIDEIGETTDPVQDFANPLL